MFYWTFYIIISGIKVKRVLPIKKFSQIQNWSHTNTTSDSIKKQVDNWNNVFDLAIVETGILTFIPAKYSLKPDTVISLNSIIRAGTVSQSLITPLEVRINITAATNSLSAIGSRKVPKLVTSFLNLAIYPSK